MNEKFFDLKKEKQDRMLNAAMKVFAGNGYRHASTDEIVKEAGISKGLLFHYFGSKAGLYQFIYGYSVKYMLMELSGAVSIKETDFFELRAQVEKARYPVLKNFPYMQMFLKRAELEQEAETVEMIRENKEIYEEALENIYIQAKDAKSAAQSLEKLRKIVDYTLDGLLAEHIRRPDFLPEKYYKEAQAYLKFLEKGI